MSNAIYVRDFSISEISFLIYGCQMFSGELMVEKQQSHNCIIQHQLTSLEQRL